MNSARVPSISITLDLERPPQIIADCQNDGEEARLADWLEATGIGSLVMAAAELAADWPGAA